MYRPSQDAVTVDLQLCHWATWWEDMDREVLCCLMTQAPCSDPETLCDPENGLALWTHGSPRLAAPSLGVEVVDRKLPQWLAHYFSSWMGVVQPHGMRMASSQMSLDNRPAQVGPAALCK